MTLHSVDPAAVPKERWHVGKEIPLVLVITILGGIATGIGPDHPQLRDHRRERRTPRRRRDEGWHTSRQA